jgi:hypothetical protein
MGKAKEWKNLISDDILGRIFRFSGKYVCSRQTFFMPRTFLIGPFFFAVLKAM